MKLLLLLISIFILGADSIPHSRVIVCGGDEQNCADVDVVDGKRRLRTDAGVAGRDPNATGWFYLGTAEDGTGVGAAGDTIRVEIPSAVTPLGVIYPAVDVTTTVQAGDLLDDNPEEAVAVRICTDLTADADFIASWQCQVIPDHSGVFISSLIFNEFGQRTTWTVSATGTTVVTQVQTDIARRDLAVELSRSPNDPRQGRLNITGDVQTTPGGVGTLFLDPFLDGASFDMRVDGSSTPVSFTIPCSNDGARLVNEIRIFGGCNGIKFKQFLCKNQALTNGMQFTIRSEAATLVFPFPLKTTEDFKNKFAYGAAGTGGNFSLDIQAGGDQFLAAYVFQQPAILRKCGSIPGPDDYMEFTVEDNLTGPTGGNLNELISIAQGFLR